MTSAVLGRRPRADQEAPPMPLAGLDLPLAIGRFEGVAHHDKGCAPSALFVASSRSSLTT